MTTNEESGKKTQAVVTNRRINPASLMRSRVKTVLRTTPPLKSDHELPPVVAAIAKAEKIVIPAARKSSENVGIQSDGIPKVDENRCHIVSESTTQAEPSPDSLTPDVTDLPVPPLPAVFKKIPEIPKMFIRPEPVEFDDSGDFGSLLDEMESVKRSNFNTGDKVIATIVHMNADTAFLSLGQKAEGAMELAELRDTEGQLLHKVGDRINCFIVLSQGGIRLTQKLGRQLIDWNMLSGAKENALPIEGKIEKTCKGGYDVSLAGIRAFCPQGQIDLVYSLGQEESWVGKTELFYVTEVSAADRNVVVSRRAYLEEIRKQHEAELLKNLSIGDMIEGSISRVVDFGAFVDIGGTEGLIPLSQISHGFVSSAEEFVKVGDKVTVQIIKIEADPKRVGRMRIGLSLKAVQQNPFQQYEHELKAGATLNGRVLRVEKYGAFVELFPGVDGLLHISEMTQLKGKAANEAFAVGQRVDVRIAEVDREARRISLTLGDRLSAEYESKTGKQQSTGLGTFADIFPRK